MRLQDYVNLSTFVTSVGFNEDSLEITFIEDRDSGEDVLLAKTLVMTMGNPERMQLYAEIQERLCDLIEWGLVELRNPPRKITIQEHRAARLEEEATILEEPTTDEG